MRCAECRAAHAKQYPREIGSWLCRECHTAHLEGIQTNYAPLQTKWWGNVRRALEADDVEVTKYPCTRKDCECDDTTRSGSNSKEQGAG